jgi:hypothetical protein
LRDEQEYGSADDIDDILTSLSAKQAGKTRNISAKGQGAPQKTKTLQIGSYKKLSGAKQAWREFERLAGEGTFKTVVSGKGKKKLYRAQVHQISASSATKACQKWRSKGNECTFK